MRELSRYADVQLVLIPAASAAWVPSVPGGDPHRSPRLGRPSAWERARLCLIHYLVAKLQALVTDPRITGRCHSRDLVAVLVAEAAPFCPGLSTHLLDRGGGRAGCPAGFSYHRLRAPHAAVADVSAFAGDQRRDLLLAPPAERARQIASTKGHQSIVLMRSPVL
jgi:hypothetical protein